MAKAIELEKVDEHGKPVKCLMARQPRKPQQGKKQLADTMGIMASSDDDDRDYDNLPPLESVVTSDSESDSDDTLPSNAEIANILPSKTVPAVGRGASRRCMHSKPAAPTVESGEIGSSKEIHEDIGNLDNGNKDTHDKVKKQVCLDSPPK